MRVLTILFISISSILLASCTDSGTRVTDNAIASVPSSSILSDSCPLLAGITVPWDEPSTAQIHQTNGPAGFTFCSGTVGNVVVLISLGRLGGDHLRLAEQGFTEKSARGRDMNWSGVSAVGLEETESKLSIAFRSEDLFGAFLWKGSPPPVAEIEVFVRGLLAS